MQEIALSRAKSCEKKCCDDYNRTVKQITSMVDLFFNLYPFGGDHNRGPFIHTTYIATGKNRSLIPLAWCGQGGDKKTKQTYWYIYRWFEDSHIRFRWFGEPWKKGQKILICRISINNKQFSHFSFSVLFFLSSYPD